MSMADALEKDFMLRSTVAQQPEPMPQKQQQRQQPVVKRSVKSQSSSDDGRGNPAAPDLSAHTSPSSTSPAGSVGRRSRLSLQRRKSEAANMRAEDSKSDEIRQKAQEKEREERERREKKEEEERERREKENEERERREKQERERKEKEERERREKEKTERERREREVKEKEERERREKKEKEERERERREREKKEKEERERERREKEKTEQEEKERKRKEKEKEEHEANEKAREKQKRSEAMSASGPSRGQARGVPPGGQTGGPDSRASRPTGLKEGKRAIDETREDEETAQAPHASRPPATPTEESRSPTKKQKVDDQQDEGALYLDGINLLRAEQNYEVRGGVVVGGGKEKGALNSKSAHIHLTAGREDLDHAAGEATKEPQEAAGGGAATARLPLHPVFLLLQRQEARRRRGVLGCCLAAALSSPADRSRGDKPAPDRASRSATGADRDRARRRWRNNGGPATRRGDDRPGTQEARAKPGQGSQRPEEGTHQPVSLAMIDVLIVIVHTHRRLASCSGRTARGARRGCPRATSPAGCRTRPRPLRRAAPRASTCSRPAWR
jgi:hypothetical protein